MLAFKRLAYAYKGGEQTTVSLCEGQQNLYNEDTIGTTVHSPVQWNLYIKDTIGTTVNSPFVIERNMTNY